MEQKPTPPETAPEEGSLDTPATTVTNDPSVISAESANPIPVGPPPKPPLGKRLVNGLFGMNLYLLLFIFVLAVAGLIVLFTMNYSKGKSGTAEVGTTSLSQETLSKLATGDANVGTSSQVLNVQSSAIFAGKVLTRSDLEVAGNLQIGGKLNIANLSASETAQLGQTTVSRNLAVTGDVAVQGAQTIAKSLQVAGSGTFNGTLSAPQISTNSLQLNGELTLTRHLVVGGGTPSRAGGSALGSGGSSSVGGSDTAGSVSINTGGGPSAGCFVSITFAGRYNSTPRVIVTPIGVDAARLDYYINRSATGFSICSASTPPSGANFGFDYFVIG